MTTSATRLLALACGATALIASGAPGGRAWGQVSGTLPSGSSAPAILQWFEGSYKTIERRTVDAFVAGYGAVWLPPPGRADSGNGSVGYDVYDRFDLGSPGNPTLYGTETGLKAATAAFQRAGARVFVDLVWNHSGFRDSSTNGFLAQGGYPGLVLTWPGTTDGDYHSAFASGDLDGRLAGLVDLDHSKNIQLIRNPVVPGDSRNIPAGTVANKALASNARFYPAVTGTPARVLTDPALGGANLPVYDFDPASGLPGSPAGTPVTDNDTGYLMRNAQWLVQTVGVDGFRLDATKSYPNWVLNYLDRAVFATKRTPLLNGARQDVFSFGEYFDGSYSGIQSTIRKDINPASPNQVGGNRDALDFPQLFALGNNLTANGLQNDWRNVVNASIDLNLDGQVNGSQGVGFAQSHDSFGPALGTVAQAYVLMRPGNAVVYFNGKEFGSGRDFPKDGRSDALGGLYGGAMTKLVDVRLRYPEGEYRNRLVEKETLITERLDSLLAAYSNRGDAGYDARTVATAFAPGTPLLELTGNAADPTVDPNGNIPELLVVNGDRTVNLRVPRNGSASGGNANVGKGYVIYGPATPQGTLILSNIAQTLGPQTPTAATNGAARLNAVSVIKTDTFAVTLQTSEVRLLGFYRDADADGDNALLKVDAGLDVNANGAIDNVTPNTSAYGFESFSASSPLIGGGAGGTAGTGRFEQSIDAAALAEGMHYLEVRAFRHRNAAEPAVFSSWRQGFYVDRLKPISLIDSFQPVVPGVGQTQRVTARSSDLTANNIHVLLDLPAALTDAEVLVRIGSATQGTQTDRDLWQKNLTNLTSGNHVLTLVTYEETGTFNVQRFPGYGVTSSFGAGLGDLDFNGLYAPADVQLFGAALLSYDRLFNPAGDLNANGLIDFADLNLLGDRLLAVNASPQTLAAYHVLLHGIVPEPAALSIFLPAAPVLLLKRRKQIFYVHSNVICAKL